MHTILPHILAIVVDVLEFPQGLYNVDILPRPGDDQFGTFMQTVIEDLQ